MRKFLRDIEPVYGPEWFFGTSRAVRVKVVPGSPGALAGKPLFVELGEAEETEDGYFPKESRDHMHVGLSAAEARRLVDALLDAIAAAEEDAE